MKKLISKKANHLFKKQKYEEALDLYQQLAKSIGKGLFDYNIKKCEQGIVKNPKIQINDSKQILNIAYISDSNYAMPTYVSICSLKTNRNKNRIYNIFVILIEDAQNEQSKFERLSGHNFYINTVVLKNQYSHLLIKKAGFHVSTAAVVKFRLPEILPKLNKILYIDSDTIINKDLYDIYKVDINNQYAAVVEDIKPKYRYPVSFFQKLKIEHHRGYFNSGVLLLNLEKMRNENIPEALLDYRENMLNNFMDQDAFNVVFKDKVIYLSCLYNFLVTLPESFSVDEVKENYQRIENVNSFHDIFRKSFIIHYASKNKPWLVENIRFGQFWIRHYLKSKAYTKSFLIKHNIYTRLGDNEIIVSLTTYPPRTLAVKQTLKSVFEQTFNADKIILWLAADQYPEINKKSDFLEDDDRDNFFICMTQDIRSFKKLIPSLSMFNKAVLITCDDDIFYHSDWLLELIADYLNDRTMIHCHRGHAVSIDSKGFPKPYNTWRQGIKKSSPSYKNFFTGCGGVLYPPKSLDSRVLKIDKLKEICPDGDDIWFWGMGVLNNTKINIIKDSSFELNFSEGSQEEALWKKNVVNGHNDKMLQNFFIEFPNMANILKDAT